jgi:hypothetical protein
MPNDFTPPFAIPEAGARLAAIMEAARNAPIPGTTRRPSPRCAMRGGSLMP